MKTYILGEKRYLALTDKQIEYLSFVARLKNVMTVEKAPDGEPKASHVMKFPKDKWSRVEVALFVDRVCNNNLSLDPDIPITERLAEWRVYVKRIEPHTVVCVQWGNRGQFEYDAVAITREEYDNLCMRRPDDKIRTYQLDAKEELYEFMAHYDDADKTLFSFVEKVIDTDTAIKARTCDYEEFSEYRKYKRVCFYFTIIDDDNNN